VLDVLKAYAMRFFWIRSRRDTSAKRKAKEDVEELIEA
jgi:hypothetical protein